MTYFAMTVNIKIINNIEEKLASLVTFLSFPLHCKEIAPIRRRGKVNMIWANFEKSIDFKKLAIQAAQILDLPQSQDFLPHITLGRTKRNKIVKIDMKQLPAIDHLALQVKKIELYESNLTPQGPIYKVLKEWYLKDSGCDC